MHDDNLNPYEDAIARRLAAYSAIEVRRADSLATARRSMAIPRRLGFVAAWTSLRPSLRMALVLAMLGALLVGGALVGSQLVRPTLTAIPSTSALPVPSGVAATPLVPNQSQGLGYSIAVPAWAADATWVADAHGIPGTADPLRLRLSSGPDGTTLTVGWGTAETESITSATVTGPAEELDLVATEEATGCRAGDLGRYQMVRNEPFITLVVIRDDCASRQQFLARPWLRTLAETSEGGRGVIDLFQPGYKAIATLPGGRYVASVSADAASLTNGLADRTFIIVRNPIGLAEPCSSSGGNKRDVASTSAAFAGYLGTLPGFTVRSEPMTIDGRPGRKLTIATTPTANCPGGRVAGWTPRNASTTTFWFITQGDPDRIYLTDVERPCAVGESAASICRDLYLVQWLGNGVTDAEEQAIVDSLVFLDSLPSPPPT